MKDDSPKPVMIQRICPVLSSAISWTTKGKDGKETRQQALSESPCLQGRCALYVVGKGCGLLP